MPKHRPAETKAGEYLRSLICDRPRKGGSRLPTVVALASAAGVAMVTMLRAVRRLRDAGVLSVSHGKGIRIVGRIPEERKAAPQRPASPAYRWEIVRDRIRADALNGVFAPGAVLPSAKELDVRYGACYRTTRRALDHLASGGALESYGRWFRIPGLTGAPGRGTVVLVTLPDSSGGPRAATARCEELFLILERECSRRAIDLEFMPVADVNRDRRPVSSRGTTVLGYLVIRPGANIERIGRLCRVAVADGCPVAVFDEQGDARDGLAARDVTGVKVFAVGYGDRAAFDIGRHLLSLGHRRIAYISPFHNNEWSPNRFAGLARAFGSAGIRDGVQSFTHDRFAYAYDAVRQRRSVHRAVAAYLASGLKRPGPPDPTFERTLRSMRGGIARALQHEVISQVMRPLFERACACGGLTAWVCANDTVAVEAMDFLARRGRTVPGHVSVAGFDDGVDAFFRKLTSYNYNMDAVVRAMLDHLLHRRHAPRPAEIETVEIEGFITRRMSTGRVRDVR